MAVIELTVFAQLELSYLCQSPGIHRFSDDGPHGRGTPMHGPEILRLLVRGRLTATVTSPARVVSRRTLMALGLGAVLVAAGGGMSARAGAVRLGSPTARLPQPGASRSLSGVACASPSNCWAVGTYQTGKGVMKNLVLRWSLKAGWASVHSPNPKVGGSLSAISCPAEKACWAAGQTGFTARAGPFNEALNWNGSQWALAPVPSKQRNCFSCQYSLSAIACLSTTACVAAGTAGSADEYFYQALVRSSTGWSTGRIAADSWGGDATEGVNGLNGAACASASNCWAVGNTGCNGDCSGGADVAVHWDGISWTKSKFVSPGDNQDFGTGPQLNSVTCLAARDCWAVGFQYDAKGDMLNQILHWNGAAWAETPAPGESSGDGTSLNSVTCTNTSNCWAVGSGDHSTNEILSWNGVKWMAVSASTPGAPSALLPSILSSVVCASASNCWAVGSYAYHPNRRHTFDEALHWNGASWSLIY